MTGASSAGEAISYAHDALGRVVERAAGEETTTYRYAGASHDPVQTTLTTDGAPAQATTYAHTPEGSLAQESGGEVRVLLTDLHADVVGVADPSGGVAGTASYSPWGERRSETSRSVRFTGQGAAPTLAPGMRWVRVAVVAVLLGTTYADASESRSAAKRPNVLVIVTDDQRAGTLAVMPAVRRWFRRGGMEFSQAFATTPLCCPSRASLMTGRYAHNHGVRINQDWRKFRHWPTIQRRLRKSGYRTGIAGKFLNGWDTRDRPPHFDRWSIFMKGYFNVLANVDGRLRTIRGHSTDFVARRGLLYLRSFEKDDRRPWYLVLAPFSPHEADTRLHPRRHGGVPLPPWRRTPNMDEEDRSDKPPYVQASEFTRKEAGRVRRRQLRSLLSVDEMVARVMRELARLGERRRTLAIFISDNGYFWGEHGLRFKRHPYTKSVKVPLLIRWPGHVPKGARDARLAGNVDVAPTILDAARVSAPADGRSLLRAWERDRMLLEGWRDEVVPWDWRSIRTPELQYIEYFDDSGLAFREFYDLRMDPWQMVNLLEDGDATNDPDPVTLAALSAQLEADATCRGADCP